MTLRAPDEPEWWQRGYHAVPGANVIVKEDDWGSIIAFTLRYVMAITLQSARQLLNSRRQFCRLPTRISEHVHNQRFRGPPYTSPIDTARDALFLLYAWVLSEAIPFQYYLTA